MAADSLTTPGAVSRRFLFSVATAAPIAAATAGKTMSRWPEWTRAELDALGLPPTMQPRPSQANFAHYFQESLRRNPENREELKRQHKLRIDAWLSRRNYQKEWYSRTGLDVINQRHRRLLTDKHRIERELMDLMIGPDKAAIDA